MSNLGNINFSDYDSDEFIGTNIYSCKNKLKPKSLKGKKININDLDLENNSSSKVFCNINKSISNNILSDCEIITYDNSIENKDNKGTEYNDYYENNNYSESNYFKNNNYSNDSEKKIGKDISSLFYNNANNYSNESSEDDFTVYFDSSKLKQCPDNIPNEKKKS